jgi:phosphoglucosamine mutase
MESALESGLSAAGMGVVLTGPLPTPAVAFLTRTSNAAAGIMISASHNPYHDNGVKFFSSDGQKLSDELEFKIETLLAKNQTVESGALGKARRHTRAADDYVDYCLEQVVADLDLKDFTIVLDCAHGAAYEVGPKLLNKLGAEVILAGALPDGKNINDECGSVHPQHMAELVKKHNADLGIALDGDADRIVLADASGKVIDGDGILFVLGVHGQRNLRAAGGIVGTVMSNLGLELACQERGIAFERSNVGDRYVLEKLYANNWTLGGETSGHIIQLDKSTTGDGLLTAVSVLEVMLSTGRTLGELVSDLQIYPQSMINVPINGSVSAAILLDDETVINAVREVESVLDCNGRVVLRPSGTEPVIRVMVEGVDAVQVETLVEQLTMAVESASANH